LTFLAVCVQAMPRSRAECGLEPEGEDLRASKRMQRMRAQIAGATALNDAMQSAAQVYLDGGDTGSFSSDDEEEPPSGKGRGAPGWKREVADIYGDPEGSIIGKDILNMRANPDDKLLNKKFRLSYRVPWLVFEVGRSVHSNFGIHYVLCRGVHAGFHMWLSLTPLAWRRRTL
jgi:hypothetical protein